MNERVIALNVLTIFKNLGWAVNMEEVINGHRFDLTLRYENKIYGFVEVIRSDNLLEKAKDITFILNEIVKEVKPLIFVITNGYAYDVYHKGEFFGTLSVPPTPEDVNLLFGGDLDA